MSDDAVKGALTGLRVLDLAGPLDNYCGKLFADMGADVILVEPPGGSPLRREPPFVGAERGAEASLAFAYANTSKRGITLDLTTAPDRDNLLRLAAGADLLIETFAPGVLDELGLGYAALEKANPRLVMTSITAFGQTGPYAHYQADDIVAMALGGLLYLGGYPDTEPITTYGNQAIAMANLFGAAGSMLALLAAQAHGTGEHVDVSMQECVTMALETTVQFFDLERTVKKRWGGTQRQAGMGVFPCKDGYIYFMAGGVAGNRFWPDSCDWLEEEGVEGAAQFREERWLTREFQATDEAKRIFEEVFTRFTMCYTIEELYRSGQQRRVPIAPVSKPVDLVRNEQLRHRDFFVPMQHFLRDEPFLVPGAPFRMSRTPWGMRRPAPRLGEHTVEVLAELASARPVSANAGAGA